MRSTHVCRAFDYAYMHPCHTHKSLRVRTYVCLSVRRRQARSHAQPRGDPWAHSSTTCARARSHSSGRRCNHRDIIANKKTPYACNFIRRLFPCAHVRSIIYISMEYEFHRNRIARHSCRHVSSGALEPLTQAQRVHDATAFTFIQNAHKRIHIHICCT